MKRLYATLATLLVSNLLYAQTEQQNPNSAAGLFWRINGNSGTVDGTNFIGTTDNVPFNIRVNNVGAGRLDTRGNIYFGQGAGNTSAVPYSNIGIGQGALQNSTNLSNLVGIGDSALHNNGVGATLSWHAIANTAIGSKVLFSNTTGSWNTASGRNALYSNTTGYSNTASGDRALYANTTGYHNVASGAGALSSNTTGNHNTAIGTEALTSNTTGFQNTAIGSRALYYNIFSPYNTAIGVDALYRNMGSDNTAIGHSTLSNNTLGINNTAVGSHSLSLNTPAIQSQCTAIGYNSGSFVVSNNSTFVGANSYPNTSGLSNISGIGYQAVPTASNEVRVGNSFVTSIGGYVGWTNFSDARYKKDVQQNVAGLDFIMRLRPVTYRLDVTGIARFLGEGEFRPKIEGREQPVADSITLVLDRKARADKEKILYTGFIAQEVEKAAQEVGFEFSGVVKPQNEHSLYGLRYAEFVVPLVKAIQEQQKQIEELQRQNAELLRLLKQ